MLIFSMKHLLPQAIPRHSMGLDYMLTFTPRPSLTCSGATGQFHCLPFPARTSQDPGLVEVLGRCERRDPQRVQGDAGPRWWIPW